VRRRVVVPPAHPGAFGCREVVLADLVLLGRPRRQVVAKRLVHGDMIAIASGGARPDRQLDRSSKGPGL